MQMAPTRTTQRLQLAAASPTMLPPPAPCGSLLFPRARDEQDDEVMGRWRSSLASGLRTGLACTIVGLVSLYAPPALRRHITFPAFSYVVTVIIVTDATVCTALSGAVSALHATLMGAAPSVLALWLAHCTGAAESVATTSAVVALTTFAVALPESVGPVAKRIALGQIIIIYVARFQQGEHPSRGFALMHPANVVACTALGVAAALLAVLVPWPRLATREARDKSRAYRLVAAERVRVMVDAMLTSLNNNGGACSRQRRWQMAACMSETKRLASASSALLRRIHGMQEGLQSERGAATVEEGVMVLEMPLTGMQMALEMMLESQLPLLGLEEHRHLMVAMRDQIRLALLLTPSHQASAASAGGVFFGIGSTSTSRTVIIDAAAAAAAHNDNINKQQLAPYWLFLLCLCQLRGGAAGLLVANDKAKKLIKVTPQEAEEEEEEEAAAAESGEEKRASRSTKNNNEASWRLHKHKGRLVAAAKCGFSLGLAVLLGLLFNNDHGFWSGLIVATTISTGRDSTWAVAAARAHGTALGSVYAALGCLLLSQQQRLLTMDLRFLVLLPWMVVATFLKRSRAYGPAGGVAAALSGVIIMGRRYDEPPMAFTVARLVETFIGISCAVAADILFQPRARPSMQARDRVIRCIATLLRDTADDSSQQSQSELFQPQLALLRRHAAEARSEPTYLWLPPFPAACYDKIQGSLGKMAQLLHLYHQACMGVAAGVDLDLDGIIQTQRRRFSSLVSTSLAHCLRMLQLQPSYHPHQEEEANKDLEAGNDHGNCCCKEATTPEEVVGAFLGEAATLLEDDDQAQADGNDKGQLVCCLGSMGLCMGEIIREAQRLESHIIDLTNLQPH